MPGGRQGFTIFDQPERRQAQPCRGDDLVYVVERKEIVESTGVGGTSMLRALGP
jgi:hypothetical protein